MNDSFQDQIIADFLSVRNFNKSCFLRGWIDENELERAQRRTLQKYAGELVDGEWLDLARAEMDLLQEEADQERVKEEYGHLIEQEVI